MSEARKPHSMSRLEVIRFAWSDEDVEPMLRGAQEDIKYLIEQLESAREIMQKLVDVHQDTYGEIDGDHLAEPFKNWLARYGSNPAMRPESP